MALPALNITYEDIDYGPLEKASWGGADLGALKDSVSIGISYEVKDKLAHQYGVSPLGGRMGGDKIEVDLTLGELGQAKLLIALQSGTASGADTLVGGMAGAELRYEELVLSPMDSSKPKLVIYRAACVSVDAIAAGEEQAGLKVKFRGYIDLSRTVGDQLYKFGDPSDVTAPTIAVDWAACQDTNTAGVVFTITDTESGVATGVIREAADDDGSVLVLDNSTGSTPTRIPGVVTIGTPNATGSCTCTFNPSTNWGTVTAALVLNTYIRDRAGNRIAAPNISGHNIT